MLGNKSGPELELRLNELIESIILSRFVEYECEEDRRTFG